MSLSKRQEQVNIDKIRHYYVSTSRCRKNLIALSKTTDKVKIDTDILCQMLKALNHVIKEN